MTLPDLLILKLGGRFTKLLIESWLGKGARSTLAGDVVDLLTGRFQSAADRRKAERELDELGDRMARELLPLFQNAERQGHVNPEAVVLALESTLAGLTGSTYLIQKDLEAGAILMELKKSLPRATAQFSRAEIDFYERALEKSVRHLVEFAARLPQFEEAFAARSLQQLTRLGSNVDDILAGVRRIEAAVRSKSRDERAREYEIDYRLAVQRNLDYLEIFGIDLPPESSSQKLSVAYVSLNLESRFGEASESLPAQALLDRLGTGNGRILIRGDAGTGKSTLLRWTARQAAAGLDDQSWQDKGGPPQSEGFLPWRSRLPFLVRLRNSRKGQLPKPDELPELVAQGLGHPPPNWVRSVLDEGRAILLLDGIDEIPNSQRETIRRGIVDLVGQYPRAVYVITTRPRAVSPDWLGTLAFQEARINPMSELDRSIFIERWHEAVAEELRSLAKTATDLPGLAEVLKRQLESNPEVARLATNPLLCAMICALHRDRRQKLPERQRQLCEDLCQALLHRRERESGLSLDAFPESYRKLDYLQKRAAVQELAHHMVLNEYSSLSTRDAQVQIGKVLKQFPGHSANAAPEVTDSLVERSGILREERPGEISFIHNAFKELLAGDYFASEDSAGLLARHALDSSWRPVILFAVAADIRGFATKVITKILEPGTKLPLAELRARQFMALQCRAAALYIDEELDYRLQELSRTLFPPGNMEDAEALATIGNMAISFLLYREELRENEAAACIRALRLIGTPEARKALRNYARDFRSTVVSELSQALNPLEIEWVKAVVLAGELLPEGIAPQVADLSPLAEHSELQNLDLTGTRVADLSPLARLGNLRRLSLWGTRVDNVSILAGFQKLQSLDLGKTQVTNLSPLAGLTDLQHLDLRQTRVTDLSPLARLAKLESLFLGGTRVEDLAPLAGLSNLRWLELRDKRARNTEVLQHLNCTIM